MLAVTTLWTPTDVEKGSAKGSTPLQTAAALLPWPFAVEMAAAAVYPSLPLAAAAAAEIEVPVQRPFASFAAAGAVTRPAAVAASSFVAVVVAVASFAVAVVEVAAHHQSLQILVAAEVAPTTGLVAVVVAVASFAEVVAVAAAVHLQSWQSLAAAAAAAAVG